MARENPAAIALGSDFLSPHADEAHVDERVHGKHEAVSSNLTVGSGNFFATFRALTPGLTGVK